MNTTYRVVFETETRPREAAISLDHVPSIQVDAPNVDIAARLALAKHIDARAIIGFTRVASAAGVSSAAHRRRCRDFRALQAPGAATPTR